MHKNKPKIDWANIKIKILPVDKANLNELNPYAKVSNKEREQAIVSISGRIWARAVKEKIVKEKYIDLGGKCNIINPGDKCQQIISDLRQ